MELYAALKEDQRTMAAYGQQLPSAEELNIMNVARMTPSQLFQLYTGSKRAEGKLCFGWNFSVLCKFTY